MPSFLPGFGAFALAGAITAAGPLVIHLLNRRRYRVVDWAAMDFLREAIHRNRKILQLRDILLLLLRTAAVLLFGLALARPFFARTAGDQVAPGAPLHAILIVDNSMSMAYRQGGDTLLDEAKSRGRELIEALPGGSRVTVLPLCGGGTFSRDAYRTKKDAEDALLRIAVVDRAGTAARAADLAREGMQQAADVPAKAKRIVFLGDQQVQNWKGASATTLKGLPEMQVVDVSARHPENSWISSFRVLDGLADVSSPTRLVATVTHQGPSPRHNVQVTLSIDGAEVASKTIDLNPDQTAEVTFEYLFNDPPEPGGVRWSTAKISLPPDRLEIDDSRFLAVPVVAALPVVFIDQYGEAEDPKRNRFGETARVRAILAPQTLHGQEPSHLVRIVRRRMDQLDEHDLRDARLVVIAGVARPDSADGIRLLRDYVRQGGQLVIAAGADFDPAAWSGQAWLEGAGILPLPLAPRPLGRTPEELGDGNFASGDFKVFSLKITPSDVSSNAYLQLPLTEPQDIVDSLREPTFFKAVVPLEDKAAIDRMVAAEARRIDTQRKQLADIDARIQDLSDKELRGQLDATDRAALDQLQRNRGDISPSWLLFDSQREVADAELPAAELAERSRPKVELRYDNNLPFLVGRDIGRGRVIMFTTGLYPSWNDMPRKYAFWLFDRILRSRIQATLPERNVDTSAAPVMVGVQPNQRNEPFVLTRPGGVQQPLEVERRGRDDFAVAVSDFAQRGIYRVAIHHPASAGDANADDPNAGNAGDGKTASDGKAADRRKADWEAVIAANGPADESKLASIDQRGLAERMSATADNITADSPAANSSAADSPHTGTAATGGQSAANSAVGGAPATAAAGRYQWVPRGQPISLSGAEVWGQDTWWWLVLTSLVCLFLESTILAWPAVSRSLGARREPA